MNPIPISGGGSAGTTAGGERVCVLHIGLAKTGTSSIQRAIADNFDALRDRFGITSYRRHRNQSWLAQAFKDDLSQIRGYPILGLSRPEDVQRQAKEAVEELRSILESERPARVVLTGENFANLPVTAMPSLHRFLAPHFDRVHIAVYVREPFSNANSAAAQRIKGGMTFANVVDDTLVNPDAYATDPNNSSALPRYRYRIEKFIQTFGQENVHIVPFDRALLRHGDATADFFWRFLGIDTADLPVPPVRENESLPVSALYALEYLNRTEPSLLDGRQSTIRSVSLNVKLAGLPGGSRFGIPGFDYARFAEIVRPDAEWLRDSTGGDIDFDLTPPQPPPPPSIDEVLAIASVLNQQSRERDQHVIRGLFFRELWRLSAGQVTGTAELERIIGVCVEADFLRTAAHNLRQSKLSEAAKIADERAAFLRNHQA